MVNAYIVIAAAFLAFLLMILSLAARPRISARVAGAFMGLAAAAGGVLYGYGYSLVTADLLTAVVKTTLSVCGMFVGKNDFSALQNEAAFRLPAIQFIFYLAHLLALYATANAAIATIGARLVRRLRLLLLRKGDLVVIYGVGDNSTALARKLLEQHSSVVFVDGAGDGRRAETISEFGCMLFSDPSAIAADQVFLRRIGARPGGRHIAVYAVDGDTEGGIGFVQRLCRAMEQRGIREEQTELVLFREDARIDAALEAGAESYGYGSVNAFSPAELAARLMIRTFPPYAAMRFGPDGRAEEDFDACVIGFGRTGQAVLCELVRNGQFAGGGFHLTVCGTDLHCTDGAYRHLLRGMREHYDIRFLEADARSAEIYDYLAEHSGTLKYLAVCTGSDAMNGELVYALGSFLYDMGCRAPVISCSRRGLACYDPETANARAVSLFSPELLSGRRLDRMAMLVNQRYSGENGRTAEENWRGCGHFSRMSCRASADFLNAFLYMAGRDRETALTAGWPPPPKVLESLAVTEHKRWCAFHFTMGFETMPGETFDRRAARFKEERAETGRSGLRIAKDMEARLHACLIPWEELDALSARENAVTGGHADYRQNNIDSILSLPELLRCAREEDAD